MTADGQQGPGGAPHTARLVALPDPPHVERVTVEKAALAEALGKAREEGRKAERKRSDGVASSLRSAHESELQRAREMEAAERRRLIAEWDDKVRHRLAGARLWPALVTMVATALVSVVATWAVARAIMLNGVEVGIDAMGRSRVLEQTLQDGLEGDRPEPEAGVTHNPFTGRRLVPPASVDDNER